MYLLSRAPHGVEKFARVFTGVVEVIRHPHPPLKKQPPGSAGRQLSQHALAKPLLHVVEKGAKSYA